MNPIEQNENNNENNQPQTFFDKLTSKDILCITSDMIPSAIYVCFLISALSVTPKFCDPSFSIILKAHIFIYTAFIIKGFIQSLLIQGNKIGTFSSKISLTSIELLIYISYYISIVLSYQIFNNLKDSCFLDNTLAFFVLFALVLLGIINFSRQVLNLIIMIILFPFMITNFFRDPHRFYAQYGIDPEILQNLPTVKADKQHCVNCVICAEDIQEGDEIMILRCPGKHCFHNDCIKSWLRVKVMCPMCRNEDIL